MRITEESAATLASPYDEKVWVSRDLSYHGHRKSLPADSFCGHLTLCGIYDYLYESIHYGCRYSGDHWFCTRRDRLIWNRHADRCSTDGENSGAVGTPHSCNQRRYSQSGCLV